MTEDEIGVRAMWVIQADSLGNHSVTLSIEFRNPS